MMFDEDENMIKEIKTSRKKNVESFDKVINKKDISQSELDDLFL